MDLIRRLTLTLTSNYRTINPAAILDLLHFRSVSSIRTLFINGFKARYKAETGSR